MAAKVWSALSTVAAVGSATVARKALGTSWRAATGKRPPTNPADPEVALKEAVLWAAFSGTFVAIVRLLATRGAASYAARSKSKR